MLTLNTHIAKPKSFSCIVTWANHAVVTAIDARSEVGTWCDQAR